MLQAAANSDWMNYTYYLLSLNNPDIIIQCEDACLKRRLTIFGKNEKQTCIILRILKFTLIIKFQDTTSSVTTTRRDLRKH